MNLFALWRKPEIARSEVVTIAEGIKTKANGVQSGCSTEHPVNAANRAKCCSQILTPVDS
jgi:hypothetical protein